MADVLHGLVAGRTVPASDLESAAPFLLLCLRGLHVHRLIDGAAPVDELKLAALLATSSSTREVPGLEQAVDWWALAYTGAPLTGNFFVQQQISAEEKSFLTGLVREAEPRTMARLAVEAEYSSRLQALRRHGDRPLPASPDMHQALLIESVQHFLGAIDSGADLDADDLLQLDPGALAARADPQRTVPRNGNRWPAIERRAADLQESARALARAAMALRALPDGPRPRRVSASEIATFRTVVGAAASDAVDDLPDAALLSRILADARNPDTRTCGPLAVVASVLSPLSAWARERLAADAPATGALLQRAADLLSSPLADTTVRDMLGEVQESAAWGMVAEAEDWLREAEMTVQRGAAVRTLRTQSTALRERAVNSGTDERVQRLLAALDDRLDAEDVDGATLLVGSLSELLDAEGASSAPQAERQPSGNASAPARGSATGPAGAGPRAAPPADADDSATPWRDRWRLWLGIIRESPDPVARKAVADRILANGSPSEIDEARREVPQLDDLVRSADGPVTATEVPRGAEIGVELGAELSRPALLPPSDDGYCLHELLPTAPVAPRFKDAVAAARKLANDGDLLAAADACLALVGEGLPGGHTWAFAYLLRAGHGQRVHEIVGSLPAETIAALPPLALWNGAVACERTGDHARAEDLLRAFLERQPTPRPVQAEECGRYLERRALVRDSPQAVEPAGPPTGTLVAAQRPGTPEVVQLARQQFEAGDAPGAITRLRALLQTQPKSPGAFLLLRILRTTGDWRAAETLVGELDRLGAATWKHYLETARVGVSCAQPRLALHALTRAHELDSRASDTSADFARLHDQASELAAQDRRAATLLRGPNIQPDVVNRLLSGGNLDRQDFIRAVRQHLDRGEVLTLAETLATVQPNASWVARAFVEALVDSRNRLESSAGRRRIFEVMVAAGDPVALVQLAAYLHDRSIGQPVPVEPDARALLRAALPSLPEHTRGRVVFELQRILRECGDADEASALRRQEFPTTPPIDVRPLAPVTIPEPFIARMSLPRSAPRALTDAVLSSNARDGAPGDIADALVAVAQERNPVVFGLALGWLVLDKRPVEALQLYRAHEEGLYPHVTIAWNVATALTNIGQYDAAAEWFLYAERVNSSALGEAQAQARNSVLSHVGLRPPARPGQRDVRELTAVMALDALPVDHASYGTLVKRLRDAVENGELAPERAVQHSRLALDNLPAAGRASWFMHARLLADADEAHEAFDVLERLVRERPFNGTETLGLVPVAAAAGRETRALEMLTASSENAQVVLAQAKLHYLLGHLPEATQRAVDALALSPNSEEARNFLSALNANRDPLPAKFGLMQPEQVYVGLTQDGSVEVLLRLAARRPLTGIVCSIGKQTVPVRDLAGGEEELVPIEFAAQDLGGDLRSPTIMVRYTDKDGRRGMARARAGRKRPRGRSIGQPETLVVPFAPTQPVPEGLFVGRERDISAITDHYGQRAQIMFVGGPRQVGKTSLVHRCRHLSRGEPSGPRFVVFDGDTFRGSHGLLAHIAEAVYFESEISGWGVQRPGPDDWRSVAALSSWVRRQLPEAVREAGVVLAIDEVQVLLDAVIESDADTVDSLASVAGALRSINGDADNPLRLLLLGSCSFRSVRDRLADTNIAAEITEHLVGFLSQADTRELVSRGFGAPGGRAYVLASAHQAFWDLTAGYPNHVHLLGAEVARVLNERRRRLVSSDIVAQAADALVRRGRTVVEHLLGREREHEYQERVLANLASVYGSDDEDGDGLTMRELIDLVGTDYEEGINRFVRLGLLQSSADGAVTVANGLLRRWLVENSLHLEMRRAALEDRRDFAALRDRGFRIIRNDVDEFGESIGLERDSVIYQARNLRPSGGPGDEGLTDAVPVGHDPQTSSVGMFVERVDRWAIVLHCAGRRLSEGAAHRAQEWEARDTHRVVRLAQQALSVLVEAEERDGWVHGNLTPENVIDRGSSGVFLADWVYGSRGRRTPWTAFRPNGFRPQAQAERWLAGGTHKHADDVFALGAIMYAALDPHGEHPYPLSASGCADTSSPVRQLVQLGVDNDLRRMMSRMLAPDEDERPALHFVRSTLSTWLSQV
ncbi:hypothetical protein [Blastococcus litoris]|uniref:hypothetical protein n=1 Tax=Blastococcus litoris TaxID=2171622 RepID=UPI0013E0286E|nr:hypothetical protein [Blastococcus litoris]